MSKLLLIDADTVVYSSSAQQQTNKCLVTNIEQGRKKLFDSKSSFNTWAKENNRDKSNYSFETVSSVTGQPSFAFQSIKQKIEKIVEASGCSDYRVCIQGEGNFRKEYQSQYVDYKGQRAEKPLLFRECFDYTVNKYGSRCVVVNGEETDDYVNIAAWESYTTALQVRKRDAADIVVAYVDKDITANGRGWFINYNKLENGIFWQDELTQAREYWTQVLAGDAADNVPGLEKLHQTTKEQFGIKRGGVGPAAAAKILDDCTTEKEMAHRVMSCYEMSWCDEDWGQRLQDNCFFLYLRRKPNEMFNLQNYMGKLK